MAGFLGRKHTIETRRRMSASAKAHGFTEEHRRKIAESRKGKHLSAEHKQKIALALRGNQYRLGIPHSKETLLKLSLHHRKHNSPQQNAKIAEANRGRICSPETRQKTSEAMKRWLANPEHHPNWQGGIALHPYPCRFNKALKDTIRERDKYQCQLCGVPETECPSTLHVHHINYKKNDLAGGNLISLCNRCNSKVNFRRQHWQIFFSRIIDEPKAEIEKLKK